MTLREAVDQMTPASVEAWLLGLEPEHKLMCDDCRNGMIAQYLTSQCRLAVLVDGAYAWQDDAFLNTRVPLPNWVDVAVRAFDRGGRDYRIPRSSLRLLAASNAGGGIDAVLLRGTKEEPVHGAGASNVSQDS